MILGEWIHGRKEGRGVEKTISGTYDGDFKAGKKDGQGTMVLPNGNKYIGQWENDTKHGIGIWYTAKDGTKKQGQWVYDKRTNWLSKPIKVGGK